MKKLWILIALAAVSCSQKWNDIAHKEVVAEIKAFGVEGQVSATVNALEKSVALLLPYDANPAVLTVTQFEMTEGAVSTPEIKVGGQIDLSQPLSVTLTTYDDYVWTITATLRPRPLSEIYNMNFDLWSKDSWGLAAPYGEDADEEQRQVWASAHSSIGIFGFPLLFPEKEFVAVPGEGKAALKLQSQLIESIGMYASGSIFTGKVQSFSDQEFKIKAGISYTKRPRTLEGFACYQPQNLADGSTDKGVIFIALADWNEPLAIEPPEKLLEADSIPGIIGYGQVSFDHKMEAYEKFSVEINYKSEATPKYLFILASASAQGDFGKGAASSVLYVDELGLTY